MEIGPHQLAGVDDLDTEAAQVIALLADFYEQAGAHRNLTRSYTPFLNALQANFLKCAAGIIAAAPNKAKPPAIDE